MSSHDETLKVLLNDCVALAEQMLRETGEFYPFGAAALRNGEIQMLGFDIGDEYPSSQALYAFADEALREHIAGGEMDAVALAADVTVPSGHGAPFPDAIRVHLEARDSSRFVYIPYRRVSRGLLRRSVDLDLAEPIYVDTDHAYFGS